MGICKRIVCECCTGAHIRRQRKLRNQASKVTLHASSVTFQEAQALSLSRVRRTSTNHPDRQRRKKQQESQIASLIIVFRGQLAPRSIHGARCILATRDEQGSDNIRRVDIRSELAIADLAFLRNRQGVIQIGRTALQDSSTDIIREGSPANNKNPASLEDVSPSRLLSDVIWPSRKIFCSCISFARSKSMKLSQHRCAYSARLHRQCRSRSGHAPSNRLHAGLVSAAGHVSSRCGRLSQTAHAE